MEQRKVGDLREAPYNPRKISAEQLDALKRAMLEFGDLSGVVFNVRTKQLVGGHQRLKHLDAAWDISSESVKDSTGTVAIGQIITPWGPMAYREVDWDEKKEKAANIAANKIGGEFDIPKLKDLLIELDDGAFDVTITGFDAQELKKLIDYVAKTPVGLSEDELKTKFEVVIDCQNEVDQQRVYEKLQEEGYSCRPLTL